MSLFTTAILFALKPYIQRLGLRYPVTVSMHPQASDSCTIGFDLDGQAHRVVVSPPVAANYAPYIPVLVKGLCGSWLGETVDPLFGTVAINRAASSADVDRVITAHHAIARVLSVWVGDVRHRHWPHMGDAEVSVSTALVGKLPPTARQSYLQSFRGLLQVSEIYGSALRHLPSAEAMDPVLEAMTDQERTSVESFAIFFRDLADLPHENASLAREAFQAAVSTLLRMVPGRVRADIVLTGDKYYWRIL